MAMGLTKQLMIFGRHQFTIWLFLSTLVMYTEGLANQCWENRIDLVPCVLKFPKTTAIPADNEYGIYSTRIKQTPLVCEIRRKNHQIKPIINLGEDPTVKYIFSPGIELDPPKNYPNKLIVMYNISCPNPDDYLYYDITTIDMEEPNCIISEKLECVDYLRVSKPGGVSGVAESCGTDPGENKEQIVQGSITMVFRTSDSNNSPGFSGHVVCINAVDNGRRKRNVDDFAQTILPKNDQERRIINKFLVRYLDDVVLEQPDEQLCDEFFNITDETTLSPYATEPPDCPLPMRRGPPPINFPGDVLLLAVDNVDNRNAIIRTVADVIITSTNRVQPGRIKRLLRGRTTVTTTPRTCQEDIKELRKAIKSVQKFQHQFTPNTTEDIVSHIRKLLEEHKQIQTQELREMIREISNGCLPLGKSLNPAPSCKMIPRNNPSGKYWIQSTGITSATLEYCDMTRTCCDSTGGWMRVANLDMTDPSQNCPAGFRTINTPKRTCGKRGRGCYSVRLPLHKVSYSRVCGQVIAYQYYSPNGFRAYYRNRSISIDGVYVDGVSLTHSSNPRKHIWTFANALDEVRSDYNVCPCTKTNTRFTGVVPPFVGNDYFCDTGSRYTMQARFYSEDPVWDGAGCGRTSKCCKFNNPPWFCKQLPEPTTDDIELRLCTNQVTNDENIAIEIAELYVQ